MKPKKSINEDNLDELLKAYSLNERSEEENAAMAQAVFGQEYDIPVDVNKEKELLQKLSKNNNSKGGNWLWIGLFLLGLLLVTVLYNYNTQQEEPLAEGIQTELATTNEVEVDGSKLEVLHEIEEAIVNTYFDEIPVEELNNTTANIEVTNLAEIKEVAPVKNNPTTKSLFTVEEMKYYQDLKIEMIAKIIEEDKDAYTSVRENFVIYKKKKMGVSSFVIRNFSITNMEYKAFLVDLITKKNEKVLGIVLVKSFVWKNYKHFQLEDSYFKSNEYDPYPVVNISPEAALLFCKWLEKETNTFLKLNHPKAKPIKIRIPFDYEWISAAKIGTAQTSKCDGYQTIFDISEEIVNKSFLKRIKKVQQLDKNNKKYDAFFDMNRYLMSEAEILKIYEHTKSIEVIYPKGLSDISKVAHVSEFIQNKAEKIIVYGSCWETKKDYSQMFQEFKEHEASPFIGFRFVIENEKTKTYKYPFW